MLSFPLINVGVPEEWQEACNFGLLMFTLNVVVWAMSVQFLGSTAPAQDMLIMALFSVLGVFVYHLGVKPYILNFHAAPTV